MLRQAAEPSGELGIILGFACDFELFNFKDSINKRHNPYLFRKDAVHTLHELAKRCSLYTAPPIVSPIKVRFLSQHQRKAQTKSIGNAQESGKLHIRLSLLE